jgi:hypothetical protein
VETAGAPTLGAREATAVIAQGQSATERAKIPMFVEIHDSPVDGHQVDTVPASQPSSPASKMATTVMAGRLEEKKQIPSTRKDAEEIIRMLEQAMVKVCEWSERIEAQTTATVECDVEAWKQRVVNCKDALKRKVAAPMEAEKEKAKLRRAVEERDTELAEVRAVLETERRARTDAK